MNDKTAFVLRNLILKTILLTIAFAVSCHFSSKKNTNVSLLMQSEFVITGKAPQSLVRSKIGKVQKKLTRISTLNVPTHSLKISRQHPATSAIQHGKVSSLASVQRKEQTAAYVSSEYKKDPSRYYRSQGRLQQHLSDVNEGTDAFLQNIPSDRDTKDYYFENSDLFPFNIKPRHTMDDINWDAVQLPQIKIHFPDFEIRQIDSNGSTPLWLRSPSKAVTRVSSRLHQTLPRLTKLFAFGLRRDRPAIVNVSFGEVSFHDVDVSAEDSSPAVFLPAGRQRRTLVPPANARPTAEPPAVSECPALLCSPKKLEILGVNTGERHGQWDDELAGTAGVEDSYNAGGSPFRERHSLGGMYEEVLNGDQP